MSRRKIRYAVLAVLAVITLSLVGTSLAIGAGQGGSKVKPQREFDADLIGHNEVPAVHTMAHGHLTLTISEDDQSISYSLTYSGLNSAPLFSHTHFAQPNVNGAVSFFFCGGGGKPACPAEATTTPVTGTVVAADVAGITTQGMPAGNLDAIIQEIREGFAYANLHTTTSPGGEIRGEIREHHGP
jgi:hypothetical protein